MQEGAGGCSAHLQCESMAASSSTIAPIAPNFLSASSHRLPGVVVQGFYNMPPPDKITPDRVQSDIVPPDIVPPRHYATQTLCHPDIMPPRRYSTLTLRHPKQKRHYANPTLRHLRHYATPTLRHPDITPPQTLRHPDITLP